MMIRYRWKRVSFNWAAVDRPRKHPSQSRAPAAAAVASIGPRSIDRGNTAAQISFEPPSSRLQLGRGRSTAETRNPNERTPTHTDRFNWAAVDRPRKRDEPLAQRERRLLASIGPRSIDRGNHAGPRRDHQAPDASIGPRSIDRGNWIIACGLPPHYPSFNWAAVDRPRKLVEMMRMYEERLWASIGPRSIDRGNRYLMQLSRVAGSCFNWAAVDRPRKHDQRPAVSPVGELASIGPRSIDRGNLTPRGSG